MGAFPEHRMSIVTLGAKDRAALAAWYENVIGFEDFGPPEITMFDMGGFVLGIWDEDKLAEDSGQEPGDRTRGFKGVTLAYNARSETEVDEIVAALDAAGADVRKRPEKAFWGGYNAAFADPEGNAWEVAFNPFWPVRDDGRLELPKAEAK